MKEDVEIQKAVGIFKKGGIVIFPTDTLFGVGCVIDNKKSLKKLFEIRKRPLAKPLLVLASDMEMARQYVDFTTPESRDLAGKYWPGPLTIILNCHKAKVPSIVRAGGETLGVRIPDNDRLREIIRKIGKPIVAPSANFSNEKSPKKLEDVDSKLIKQVDFVVHGECKIKEASTIVNYTVVPFEVVRQGAIKI